MKRQLWFQLVTLALISFGGSAVWHRVDAATFGQQEVSQQNIIAIASPVNGGETHQLLVVEQISNSQSCWQENQDAVGTIEPLLLGFDFTGICSRATDSNGYSIRVGGEDLGLYYVLRVVQTDNVMRLVGIPISDRSAPRLEIGRTKGVTAEFVKIQLNPGWRFTKRTYNGQTLGHYYFTNDQSLAALSATSETAGTVPSTPSLGTGTGSATSPTLPTTLPSTSPTPGTSAEPIEGTTIDSTTAAPGTSTGPVEGTTTDSATDGSTPASTNTGVRVIEIIRPSAGSTSEAETNPATTVEPIVPPETGTPTPTPSPSGSVVVPTLPTPPSSPLLDSLLDSDIDN